MKGLKNNDKEIIANKFVDGILGQFSNSIDSVNNFIDSELFTEASLIKLSRELMSMSTRLRNISGNVEATRLSLNDKGVQQ